MFANPNPKGYSSSARDDVGQNFHLWSLIALRVWLFHDRKWGSAICSVQWCLLLHSGVRDWPMYYLVCCILFSSLSKLCLSVGLAYLNCWHFQPLVSVHKVVSLIRWWSIYSAILFEVFTACLTSDMVMTLYCSFRDIDSFATSFASWSAISFPAILAWPGIQDRVVRIPYLINVPIFSLMSEISGNYDCKWTIL